MKARFLAIVTALVLGGTGLAQANDSSTMDMPGMPGMKMAAAAADVAPTAANAININNFAFSPKEMTVAVGTTVTWTNKDEEPHTVVNAASPPEFKSTALDGGDTFSFKFTKPGTYRYFCSVHPFMTGTITVQ